MDLLDDEGNLFGAVNVVDALVVLFVLAVVAAGAAFVLQPEPAPEEPNLSSTHVTLDLGSQPNYVAAAINEGDTHDAGGNSELTITDVYLAPADDGQTRVSVRAELQGSASGNDTTYADAPLRLGRSLDIATTRYQVSGAIRAVGTTSALPTDTTDVLVATELPAGDAAEMTAGDQVRLGGRTVATVETVNAYATRDPAQHRVQVGLSLATVADDDIQRFGVTPVRRGNTLSLATGEYDLEGQIQRVGSLEPPGTPTTQTVTLEVREVREDVAETFHAGMTERAGGETVAQVTAVDVEPSTLITTGDDGSVNVVDHPYNRDVTLTTDLQVRETTTGLEFKGRSLQQGSTVVLDLGTTTIEATVVNADA